MTAHLIDGKAEAARLRTKVALDVASLFDAGRPPGLAVVLVGEDPASEVYVRNKLKATRAVGIRSFEHRLAASTSEPALLALIAQLNTDPDVDGVLVQLPLPPQIRAERVIEAIAPAKDVDGFHPENAGRLVNGQAALTPCTPLGAMKLLGTLGLQLAGMEALVIGRSNIVGKPVASLLLQADCSVAIAHSRSRDLREMCRRADIVVAAVGRPELVRGDWLRPGAVVIDVGINRGPSGLVGDVAFSEALDVAGAITPVPGGVGPMTIACLLENTVTAALASRPWPM